MVLEQNLWELLTKMKYKVKQDDCDHEDVDWRWDHEQNYDDYKCTDGQCNSCGVNLIEIWDYAGVFIRDKNGEPIGDRI